MDRQVIEWINKQPRSRSECISRWGHYYTDLEDRGVITVSERFVVMVGRFRDLSDRVSVRA